MAGPLDSFLGRGWSFPPSFTQGGHDVHRVADDEDIRQSLVILLSTAQGERVLLEDYGCDLRRFMFEEIDRGLINSMTSFIREAILNYETRVDLENVEIDEDESTPGLLRIALSYRVLSTNSRFNMVYPFYLNEAIRSD